MLIVRLKCSARLEMIFNFVYAEANEQKIFSHLPLSSLRSKIFVSNESFILTIPFHLLPLCDAAMDNNAAAAHLHPDSTGWREANALSSIPSLTCLNPIDKMSALLCCNPFQNPFFVWILELLCSFKIFIKLW